MITVAAIAVSLSACGEPEAPGKTPEEGKYTEAPGKTPDKEPGTETHVHTWTEATCTEPKTCTVCEETEGEALGHSLSEATYFAPAVCTVCGEEVGEKKPSYFEEKGIAVANAPADHIQKGMLVNGNDTSYIVPTDFNTGIVSLTTEPDGDGYEKVTFTFTLSGSLYYRDENGREGYTLATFDNAIFDYYTGIHFTAEDVLDDTGYESAMVIDLDGVSYTISYNKSISWNWGDLKHTADGNMYYDFVATSVYEFRVPDGYDGLVYCAAVATEYNPSDDKENNFYAGTMEHLSECQFFRLNKKAEVNPKIG